MKLSGTSAALAALYFFLSTGSAHAYLDPGAASMLLQGLIAGVAAGATAIAVFYERIKLKIGQLLSTTRKRPE